MEREHAAFVRKEKKEAKIRARKARIEHAAQAREDRIVKRIEKRKEEEAVARTAREQEEEKGREHQEASERKSHSFSPAFILAECGNTAGNSEAESACKCAMKKAESQFTEKEYENAPPSVVARIAKECLN